MSLTALERHQLDLLDRIEAGHSPADVEDTKAMLSFGFASSAGAHMSLTTAGQVHLANLRSHARDETAERMPYWKSID